MEALEGWLPSGEGDRHLDKGVCAELDKGIGKFLSHTGGSKWEADGRKSDIQKWMEDYGSVLEADEEPEVTELHALASEFGEGATIHDPWLEAHRREAAHKPSRWAEAS